MNADKEIGKNEAYCKELMALDATIAQAIQLLGRIVAHLLLQNVKIMVAIHKITNNRLGG